eukprot:SRR837773.4634.p1 GENE.SRR837773.4634~~SRR837773.4634.p1  ORF type:complete len:574 (+),score=168.24 SRR837773.4634:142-1722(+)
MCRQTLGLVPYDASDAGLRLVFRSLDADGSDEISLSELHAFVVDPVQRMHARLHAAVRTYGGDEFELFKEQDENSDGMVQWPEFLSMCRESLKLLDDESQLWLVFRAFDVDNSGHISPGEFIEFIRRKAPSAGVLSSDVGAPPRQEVAERVYTINEVICEGWLQLERESRFIRGYCRLFCNRIDAWMAAEAALEEQDPDGTISFDDVLSWRIVKESVGGKITTPGFQLFCGEVHKKFHFDKPDNAESWKNGLCTVLGQPIESFTFQAWSPKKPKAGASQKPATVPEDHPVQDYQFGSLKDLFAIPAETESLRQLDAQVLTSMKKAENRKQVLALVTRIRACLRDAAWSVGGSDWGKLFRHEDKNHSGTLSWDEFRSMCRRVLRLRDTAIPDSWLRLIFRSLDMNEGGELELEELVTFVEDPLRRMRARFVAAAPGDGDWSKLFAALDKDASGGIDWEEFAQVCRNKLSIIDDDTQLALVFDALDADGNGIISCEEMVAFVSAASADVPKRKQVNRTKSISQGGWKK